MRLVARVDSSQTRLRGELVRQLIRKDLKVKYQGSSLGFLWSLANPLLLLAIYTAVFQYILKMDIPFFGLFLMSGLLVWNFFSMSVSSCATSILGNAGLVKKVPFPHAALPIASIGFAGVQVALQLGVLVVILTVVGMAPIRPELALVIPATIIVIMLAIGLGFFVAATTVRFRDTQHILEVALFAWFWLTPIVYQPGMVRNQLGESHQWIYYLNPMSGVVVNFQRALYGTVRHPSGSYLLPSDEDSFYLQVLGQAMIIAVALLCLGVWQFRRMSADFAEAL
jgi:ABC-2 type transport system permease protein